MGGGGGGFSQHLGKNPRNRPKNSTTQLINLIIETYRGLQPYVLGLLIRHFDPRANSSNEQAYTYAIALVAMIIFQAMIGHHSVVGRKQVGLRISVAYSALIYRKVAFFPRKNQNDFLLQ